MLASSGDNGGMGSAGVFSGIGGLELGLAEAGFHAGMMCEIDPTARHVLRERFEGVELAEDIQELAKLPAVDMLTAGFPCQDLSQAGRTGGINGAKSGIVQRLFALIESAAVRPAWVLIENVPFMLQLNQGAAMAYVTSELGRLGYSWAYRVVDSRAFGLPQRRRRVYLLASLSEDPRVIHAEDAGELLEPVWRGGSAGFYWTEGNTGLGWAPGAIPTLKCGSGLGIPSAPAVWLCDGTIGTPDIRDAERLQGFIPGWTENVSITSKGVRWRLVGNAVSVPVAQWIGGLLSGSRESLSSAGALLHSSDAWPSAAWGSSGKRYRVECSAWPRHDPLPDIADFLQCDLKPLSLKASEGFFSRLKRSSLRRPTEFDLALESHINKMRELQ